MSIQTLVVGSTVTGLYGQLQIQANGNYTYNANLDAAKRLLNGEVRSDVYLYHQRFKQC